MAPIQPTVWISFCRIGAKTNWPKEPPALMTPDAAPRDSSGRRAVAAPISTEKLPAPEPMAESRPSETISPQVLPMNGVIALPAASSSKPPTSTFSGP
jgi:hypothetical protein